jgi:diguanylate cyclase (GGDEF)-like protein/PAS domain S-box-containing protein
MAWYGLWLAVVTTAYYALPPWHVVLWAVIGVSAAGAVLLGVLRNRPRRRLPWLLLGAALLLFNAGDTTYNVVTEWLGWDNPFPSVVDGIYLLGFFPAAAAGVFLLARSHTSQDRDSLIDAITLTVGLGLLSWIFLINPYVQDPQLTGVQKVISVAYPLCDVLLLATVARLVGAVRWSPALALLGTGGAALLSADVLYGLMQLEGTYHTASLIDLLWIVYYACWGAAALHPSMVRTTEPRMVRRGELSRRRLALMTLSSLIAPAVLLVEAATGAVRDGAVIALCSTVLFTLVLTRLFGAVAVYRRALGRERGLRQAGAAMVSATDLDDVAGAVRTAVAELVPPDTPHHVLLAAAGSLDAGAAGAPAGTGLARMVYTGALGGEAAAGLGGFEVAVLCPLLPEEARGGAPRIGGLLVAADEAVLVALQPPLEVLASQAALALQRIALTAEINERRSEEYFRTLVQNSSDVVLILDGSRIRYASPSAAAVFGMSDLRGAVLESILHPDDRALAGQILELVRVGVDEAVGGGDWRVQRAGGSTVQVEASCRDLRRDPTVHGLVLTLRDVTERRRLEEELTHRALHDSLTGLANRVLLQERAEQAIGRSARGTGVVGVLFIDVDDFNVVNDTMGHQVGDELLVAVAQRLLGVLRPHDTAARVGGDEFAILIEDARDPAEVEELAERVVAALAAPFSLHGSLVAGSASIGLATTADASDAKELMRQADLALYVAKGGGKSQWRRYQPSLHAALVERMAVRAALEKALADGAFVLHYQPIVELKTGTTVGFEALVRWQDPERGLVPPGGFIEIAEESGLIVPIGAWVLEEALATAQRWGAEPGARQPYISVNVSARQFRTVGFVDEVLSRLRASGLPASALMLEITESLLLREDEQVWRDLAALRDSGIRIAIDDFGTGYSSLSYLRQLPIDVIKLDRSFVTTITSSDQQRALVHGIVGLAHTLGMATTAEGIEVAAEQAELLEMGCQYGQGYLFSKPLGYADAVRWLVADQVAA